MKHLRKLTSCYVISNGTSADTLVRFIQKTAPLYCAGQSNDLAAAAAEIAASRPDITFLDMAAEGPEWMELMDIICGSSCLIVISDSGETALLLYKRFTTDFMMAPLNYPDFLRVVTKTQLLISNHTGAAAGPDPHSFYITEERGRLVRILYDDILYIQGAHNYIRIQLEHLHYLVYLSLKDMEKELPAERFVRVHKSFIVNTGRIRAIEWNKIVFAQDVEVAIGETYRQQFMELIARHVISVRREE